MHFTDFLRACLGPSFVQVSSPQISNSPYEFVPSARNLREAGVKFKTGPCTNLLDIEFSKGELEIPKLTLHNGTEVLFRNLLTFEQCHYMPVKYIADYITLMNNLLDSPDDIGRDCYIF